MQDRFKFRGLTKGKEPNKWIYGSLLWYADEPQIWDGEGNNYLVRSETVGQCTGLKDKNGTLIFEGDIVKINTHYNHLVCDDYEYDCESEKGYSLFKIIYDDDMARFGAERIKCVKWETHHYSLDYVPHNHKVIGNIYENPELIGGEEC